MVRLLTFVAILASSSIAAAQWFPGASDVCNDISFYHFQKGLECHEIRNSGQLEFGIESLCSKIAKTDSADLGTSQTTVALDCVKKSIDKTFDRSAVDLCTDVLKRYPYKVLECVESIVDKEYTIAEIRLCRTGFGHNVASGLGCLNRIGKKSNFSNSGSCNPSDLASDLNDIVEDLQGIKSNKVPKGFKRNARIDSSLSKEELLREARKYRKLAISLLDERSDKNLEIDYASRKLEKMSKKARSCGK